MSVWGKGFWLSKINLRKSRHFDFNLFPFLLTILCVCFQNYKMTANKTNFKTYGTSAACPKFIC